MNDKERDEKLIEISTEIAFFNKHIPQLLHDVTDLSVKVSANDTLTYKAIDDVKSLNAKVHEFMEKNGDFNARIVALEKEKESNKDDFNELWEAINHVKEITTELKTYHTHPEIVTQDKPKSWIDKMKEIQFLASLAAVAIGILWILFKIYYWLSTQIPGLPGA